MTRRAIQRACDLAFPPPAEWLVDDSKVADVLRWRMKHRWFPHQLRHNAGTNLRKQFGIEISRIILGHRSVAVNEIYSTPAKPRRPSSPRTESLSAGRETVVVEGERNKILNDLIAEQKGDREPSPLESDPPDRSRRIHFRKRL